jgi:twitching motility protein PilJ
MDGTQKPTAVPRPARAPKQPASSAAPSSSGGFLGNLKVGQKLALIAGVFLVPVAVLLYFLVSEQGKSIDFAAKEVVGAQYLVQVNVVLDDIKRHRRQARSTIIAPTLENRKKLTDEAAKVDASLSAIMSDSVHGNQFGVIDDLVTIKSTWDILKGDVLKLDQIQNLNRHSAIIADQLAPLIVKVANRSNLTLDPDIDSYYLMNSIVNDLPKASELLSKLASYSFVALSSKTFIATEKVRVDLLGQQLQAAILESTGSLNYALEGNPSLKDTLGKLGDSANTLTKAAISLSRSYVVDAATPNYSPTTWNAEQGKASEAILALRDTTTTQLIQLLQDRISKLQTNRLVSLSAVAAALALTLGLLLWIARLITRPLNNLTGLLEKVGQGDLSQFAQISSKDEIGVLAGAFNTSIQNLRATERRNQEELERTKSLQNNIGEFLNVTMDISQGNLTRKGKVSEDVLGNVVDAINVMTEEIGYLLKDVERVAQQVNSGSNDVNTANNAILQGAQSQSQIAQKARAQALEVTNSIRAMAQKALETAQASQQTLQASQAGQVALQETLSGMQNIRREVQGISKSIKSLSDRSLEISEITETISGIASQTNMLALNAAIEASGAGEAGARFAIVADEVRKLAEDSARATGRVTNLIKNIQNEIQSVVIGVEGGTREVEQGYKIATQAGERLKEISVLANQSAVLVQTISSATRAQAGGVEQVKNAVEAIAQSAGQTEAQSNQGRESAAELQKLSLELTSSLSRFQLPS